MMSAGKEYLCSTHLSSSKPLDWTFHAVTTEQGEMCKAPGNLGLKETHILPHTTGIAYKKTSPKEGEETDLLMKGAAKN